VARVEQADRRFLKVPPEQSKGIARLLRIPLWVEFSGTRCGYVVIADGLVGASISLVAEGNAVADWGAGRLARIVLQDLPRVGATPDAMDSG
jgi:hypothetical protein